MIHSKYLNKRIVIINEAINDTNASIYVEQLIGLYEKSSTQDIYIFIDSPGGAVTSCFAIFDTIRWCKCNVNTICLNFSASLSTLLLSAGTKGKRYAFSGAEITPTLYTSAKTEAIYSSSAEISNKITEKTIELFSSLTQIDYLTMKSACLTEHFLTAKEAYSKGFIDGMISDKCYSIKMLQAAKKHRFIQKFDEIWYDNIVKKLESIGIIK